MLQGDAIREITLEGPGAGGIETASAVVGDLVSIVGTTGTGFLQNDPVWQSLPALPPGELPSPHYLRLEVEDRAGVLAAIAQALAAESVSVARLVQQAGDGHAGLHAIPPEAAGGCRPRALARDHPRGPGGPRRRGPNGHPGAPGVGWGGNGAPGRLRARRRRARLGLACTSR